MWCEICHNGGPNYNPVITKTFEHDGITVQVGNCNQCGGKDVVMLDKSPFPDKPQKMGSGKQNEKTTKKQKNRRETSE